MIRADKVLKGLMLLGFVSILGACSSPDPLREGNAATKAPPPIKNQPVKVGEPYKIAGKWYYPKEEKSYDESGMSSWYGKQFHKKKTANGEIFDMNKVTAAHRTLPLPSYVKVTNLGNGRSIVVRVNDRGPYAHNRILDVSRRTAQLLGYEKKGVQRVRVQLLDKDGNITKPSRRERRQAERQAKQQPNSRLKEDKKVASVAKSLDSGFYVQVGSYGKSENASRAKELVTGVGEISIQQTIVNGQRVFRVKVGPYKSKKNATRALKMVKKKGFDRARVFTDAVG